MSDLRCYICAEAVEVEHVRHAGDRRVYCSGHCLRMLAIVVPVAGEESRLRPANVAGAVSEGEVRHALRARHARSSNAYYYRVAVRALAGREFASHEAAVAAVVSRVVSRIWGDEAREHFARVS